MAAEQLEHLKLIQAVITRMAGNSFECKKWSVTLTTGFLALAASMDKPPEFLSIGFVPPLAFWYLDAFHLRQERLFRDLYDKVRGTPEGVGFSMDTREFDRPLSNALLTPAAFMVHLVAIGLVLVVVGVRSAR